jgi:hypothetical protein
LPTHAPRVAAPGDLWTVAFKLPGVAVR